MLLRVCQTLFYYDYRNRARRNQFAAHTAGQERHHMSHAPVANYYCIGLYMRYQIQNPVRRIYFYQLTIL